MLERAESPVLPNVPPGGTPVAGSPSGVTGERFRKPTSPIAIDHSGKRGRTPASRGTHCASPTSLLLDFLIRENKETSLCLPKPSGFFSC